MKGDSRKARNTYSQPTLNYLSVHTFSKVYIPPVERLVSDTTVFMTELSSTTVTVSCVCFFLPRRVGPRVPWVRPPETPGFRVGPGVDLCRRVSTRVGRQVEVSVCVLISFMPLTLLG